MTLSEFKAWLEGYSEAFTGGAPNADQWNRITHKLDSVALLRDAPIVRTEPNVKIETHKWPYASFSELTR